jgi:hypothetical protein
LGFFEVVKEAFHGSAGFVGHFSRLIRAHWFLLPPIPHLFVRVKVILPGLVEVRIKAILFPREWRERWGWCFQFLLQRLG